MPDYDDLCDELTYDELTDGLSTCSGSVNDLLDQLEVEEYRHNDCHNISYSIVTNTTLPLVASMGWTPQPPFQHPPPPRLWAYIRGRYWSAKIAEVGKMTTFDH
jgi:hypothetical protein